jgi:hypothetical protein
MPDAPTSSTDEPPACRQPHGDDFAVPAEPGARFGAPGDVDGDALAQLVGAALDACAPCQHAGQAALLADRLTATRLVEHTGVAVADAAGGGLPPAMLTENDAESTLSPGYRALLRAGVDQEDHSGMYAAAVAMSEAELAGAVDNAMDMLVGILSVGTLPPAGG